VVLLAAGIVLRLDGARVLGGLAQQLRHGIDDAVAGRPAPGSAVVERAGELLALVGPLLAVLFGAGLVATLVPALVARRGRGSTAVALPAEPRRNLGRAVLGLAAAALIALLMLALLGQLWPAVLGLSRGGAAPRARLLQLAASAVAGTGALLVLAGLADLSLERVRLLRGLALTRSEQRTEWREQGGDPDVRRQVRRLARPEGRR
jgi:hypothetical protein